MRLVTSERVRVRRSPERGHYARSDIHEVLDAAIVAHVAFIEAGRPYCMPFLHVRVGETLYIHGSTGSRALRILQDGAPACVTITMVDGLVLARSVFEHSANYRSAVLLGRFTPVPAEECDAALKAFTNRLVPGRWAEVRRPSPKELAATSLLALTIDEASVKVRTGPPSDGDSSDATDDVWAGVLPMTTRLEPPEPAPELRHDLPLPQSVRHLYAAANNDDHRGGR
ncbi:pyridoxamine 5'-phosphate oxidase family protein [Spongiactinospora rosea]|uniref:Pyridoxamine 5'-phosphate oxidase family protein n=1 Tax=Spongiactinospora rosea TaxID=2248750 RepID=A0A366LL70_9ACTN|nr:pyridoxamine 5'-phosphate oxidase family protein [Spongiactinospora rosea]